MNNTHYNPNDATSLSGSVERVILTVKVLGGRNLTGGNTTMGVVQPFVGLEITGLPVDNQNQRTTPRKGLYSITNILLKSALKIVEERQQKFCSYPHFDFSKEGKLESKINSKERFVFNPFYDFVREVQQNQRITQGFYLW